MSQKQKTASRKRLTAAKLRLKLGGWPDIREPLPPKAKWKHKKHYQRLRNQIQELEAQANRTRFRKQIDIRTSLITSDYSDIITIIGIELNGSRSCFEAAHGLQSRAEDVTVRLAEPIGVFTGVESPNYGPPNADADDRIF